MEKIIASWSGVASPEPALFLVKSGLFLLACGATLYILLAADYPAIHDTFHHFRHALAVVPCH